MSDYAAFLASKRVEFKPVGFMQLDFNPHLKPFQKSCVSRALAMGRSAWFEDCGLGKSIQELEWAYRVAMETQKPVLILTPLGVTKQFEREALKFGFDGVKVCREPSQIGDAVIVVTNYERLHHFDRSMFGGVILDECFAKGTKVDVYLPEINRSVPFSIEKIRPGDSIYNASGLDTVSDVHRREVKYATRVTYGGRSIIASPNHPFFTERGWVGAQDLEPGDRILQTRAAMRVVQDGISSETSNAGPSEVLREILLSEMADESTRKHRQSSQSDYRSQARQGTICLPEIDDAGCYIADRADQETQTDDKVRDERESFPPIERDGPRTFRAWGQWKGFDCSPADITGCTWVGLGAGVSFVTGSTESILSDALQARHRQRQSQSQYRGGWSIPSLPQRSRQETGRDDYFIRVDSLEILEPGHPDLEELRDEDGKLYFYDLGGTRHPSFSVNGGLVHNSSILKSFNGSTRKQLTEFASTIHYRLAATATPAPNDLIELTNHAEFLGVMTGKEIIACFFTQDGNSATKFRLKKHAEPAFWAWLATWTTALRKPSDLGFDDAGYVLPELIIKDHIIASKPLPGQMFVMEAQGLAERRKARRFSLADRVQIAADISAAEPDEPWLIWCDLNDEAEALTKLIPGSVECRGTDDPDDKEAKLTAFADGRLRVLVTKPSIAGWGLNFQHCARTIFVGLSDSFEQQYQAIRRFWRFGQDRPVHVYLIASEAEGSVLANLRRKETQANEMYSQLVGHMKAAMRQTQRDVSPYNPTVEMMIPSWLTSEIQS